MEEHDLTLDDARELVEVEADKYVAKVGALTIQGANNITSTIASASSIQPHIDFDDIFDRNCMQRLAIDYKISEHEFIKMKETNPAFADEVKEKIARELAGEVAKRTTYTKRVDKDLDTHHFIGRAWVFSDSELKDFIRNILNVR